jgi:hypothetical protein
MESRTSDDSGLTSDDTSGDKITTHQVFTASVVQSISEVPNAPLMTQSTSALIAAKKSPRRILRPAPNNSQLNASINQGSNDSSSTLTMSTTTNVSTMNGSASSTVQAHASSSSSTDTSPLDEKRPIPIPRGRPIMGNQMILMGNKSRLANQIIERDSLNSYEVEETYYEGDDEVFDEIDCAQSTAEQSPSSGPQIAKNRYEWDRRLGVISIFRMSRYADYVNLADFCVVRDSTNNEETVPRDSLPYLYSDIGRVKSEQPELPKHRPFMQWEQKLYRTAEKCLSVIEPNLSSSLGNNRDDSPASCFKNSVKI